MLVWMDRELQAETDFDICEERKLAISMRSKMYKEQGQTFDAVIEALGSKSPASPAIFFVDGPGGSGKSFLFEALLHHVRGQAKVGIACAWSGLAAALLPGGRTVTSRFGLPVPLPESDVQPAVKAAQAKGRLLKAAELIVWDEVSMTPKGAVEAADVCLKDICQNDLPFGGKVVVDQGFLMQEMDRRPRQSPNDTGLRLAHAVRSIRKIITAKQILFSQSACQISRDSTC